MLACGMELCAARAEVKHGQWETWVEDNCLFSCATALRYMRAVILRAQSLSNPAHVRDLLFRKSLEGMTEDERARLTEALQAASKGVSIRQLYLDLGMIAADPNKQSPKLVPGAVNPYAELEFHKGQAIEVFNAVLVPLGKYVLTPGKHSEKFLNLLSQEQRETFALSLSEAAAVVKKFR